MRIPTKALISGAFLALGAALVIPATADAQPRRGPPHAPRVSYDEDTRRYGDGGIVGRVLDYYRDYRGGYSRRELEALPPGIRKRLARGKPLPPGIAKKMRRGPRALERRFDDRYVVMESGRDVLLLEAATGMVARVLRDVIR